MASRRPLIDWSASWGSSCMPMKAWIDSRVGRSRPLILSKRSFLKYRANATKCKCSWGLRIATATSRAATILAMCRTSKLKALSTEPHPKTALRTREANWAETRAQLHLNDILAPRILYIQGPGHHLETKEEFMMAPCQTMRPQQMWLSSWMKEKRDFKRKKSSSNARRSCWPWKDKMKSSGEK